ncbi:MAG: MoxR family ATPase [Pseudomonadota bacterium]
MSKIAEPADILEHAESVAEKVSNARSEIASVIFGQDQVIEQAIITLLAGGHALLVGVPGLAKTRLVETMGTVLGLDAGRVQFTPDLVAADIIGSEVLEENEAGKRQFRFIKGPVFAQLLMADEINRASPRTQSALLQSMQEYQVTVSGEHYDLPSPFHVLATQNPLEQEGTYPLPEAQLDRFLMQIDVDYPDLEAERRMLLATTGSDEYKPTPKISSDDLKMAQRIVRQIPVGETVVAAILELVRSARPGDETNEHSDLIEWGPGPRASQALLLTARARALLNGHLSPTIDDVIALAKPVLQHRMALKPSARRQGNSVMSLIDTLLTRIQTGSGS